MLGIRLIAVFFCIQAFSLFSQTPDSTSYNKAMEEGASWLMKNPKQAASFFNQAYEIARFGNQKYGEALALKELGKAYFYQGKADSVLVFWQLSNQKLLGIGGKPLADSYNNLGIIYQRIGNLDSSQFFHDKSLKIRTAIKDTLAIADSYFNIGSIERTKGNLNKALNHYLSSLKIYQLSENEIKIGDAYNSIALVYLGLEQYQQCLYYQDKAIKIKEKNTDNPRSYAGALNNMAACYLKMEKYEEALNSFIKAEKVYEGIGDYRNLTGIYINLSSIYKDRGELDIAKNYLNSAILILRQLNDKETLAMALNNLGAIYLLEKDFKNAEPILLESFELANEVGNKIVALQAAKGLGDLYFSTNNFGEAVVYNKIYVDLNDSIFSNNMAKEVASLQEKYEAEKKAKEIEALKNSSLLDKQEKESQRNIFIGTVGIFILIILILLLILSKVRYNRKLAQKEKKATELELTIKEKELEGKSRELTTYAASSVQTNKFMQDVLEEIERLNFNHPEEIEGKISSIKQLLKSSAESEDVWERFKVHFEGVHPAFFENLQNKFPQLTPNDLKQAAYIRLNLSSKDVAIMMNITPKSAKMNRYRLKKKLALEQSDSLSEFLMNF